jgi:hypothetical protein
MTTWLDRLLGRSEDAREERDEDKRALRNLRDSFRRVRTRTERLEQGMREASDAAEREAEK